MRRGVGGGGGLARLAVCCAKKRRRRRLVGGGIAPRAAPDRTGGTGDEDGRGDHACLHHIYAHRVQCFGHRARRPLRRRRRLGHRLTRPLRRRRHLRRRLTRPLRSVRRHLGSAHSRDRTLRLSSRRDRSHRLGHQHLRRCLQRRHRFRGHRCHQGLHRHQRLNERCRCRLHRLDCLHRVGHDVRWRRWDVCRGIRQRELLELRRGRLQLRAQLVDLLHRLHRFVHARLRHQIHGYCRHSGHVRAPRVCARTRRALERGRSQGSEQQHGDGSAGVRWRQVESDGSSFVMTSGSFKGNTRAAQARAGSSRGDPDGAVGVW